VTDSGLSVSPPKSSFTVKISILKQMQPIAYISQRNNGCPGLIFRLIFKIFNDLLRQIMGVQDLGFRVERGFSRVVV